MSHKNSVLEHRKILNEGSLRWSSLDDCKGFAQEIQNLLPYPATVCLNGPMGTGKTQFVRYLVNEPEVSSPTFSLQNIYRVGSKEVRHFDLHRLETESAVESSGFWDAFTNPAWILIEWAEHIDASDLPHEWPLLFIDISSSRAVIWKLYAAADRD